MVEDIKMTTVIVFELGIVIVALILIIMQLEALNNKLK
jgi:hypothetical protein